MGADPVSLGLAGLGLIGSGVKAFGEMQSGDYNAKLAEQNAALADTAAGDAQARGQEQATAIRSQTDQMISEQRSSYGASGVDLSSGSPLDVMVGSRAVSARDEQTARNNGAREAWGYRAQASQYRDAAANSRATGLWNAGSTMLTGAANFGVGAGKALSGGGDSLSRTLGERASRTRSAISNVW